MGSSPVKDSKNNTRAPISLIQVFFLSQPPAAKDQRPASMKAALAKSLLPHSGSERNFGHTCVGESGVRVIQKASFHKNLPKGLDFVFPGVCWFHPFSFACNVCQNGFASC